MSYLTSLGAQNEMADDDTNQPMAYTIGDRHGEITLLEHLLEILPFEKPDTLVFLGDCLDRGEDSLATI
jgi:hypothetical protein